MVEIVVFGNRCEGMAHEEMLRRHREVHVPLGKP
jgi:hypothetical protein